MNQQEKSALSKTRILYAALQEFSEKGYEGAALNAVWARGHFQREHLSSF